MLKSTINATRLTQKLDKIATRLGEYPRQYLITASAVLSREQNRHFTSQSAPDGTPWKPLSSATLAISQAQAANKKKAGQKTARVRRTSGSKILMNTGLLRASVTVDGATGAIREITPDTLRFGTNLRYAAVHQFGATITVTPAMRGYLWGVLGINVWHKDTIVIPARPFLGVGAAGREDLKKAANSVAQRLAK